MPSGAFPAPRAFGSAISRLGSNKNGEDSPHRNSQARITALRFDRVAGILKWSLRFAQDRIN